MIMTMLAKEKIRGVLSFLEDEIGVHAKPTDEKPVFLRMPVRRLLARITSSSKKDLLTVFRKLRSDDVLRIKDIDDLEKKEYTTALDNIEIEIYPQKFFEYKKIIFEEGPKPEFPKPAPEDVDSAPSNNRPFCVVENGWGYLKFGKYSEKIDIGSPESRHFRLLQYLIDPKVGTAKTIEGAFDAIRLLKDKNDPELSGYDAYRRKSKQIAIIQNTIKELQKGNKMQNKLKFKFDDTKNKLWLDYIE